MTRIPSSYLDEHGREWPLHVEAEAEAGHGLAIEVVRQDITFTVAEDRVREIRDRLRAATINAGMHWPHRRWTVRVHLLGAEPATQLPHHEHDLPLWLAMMGAADAAGVNEAGSRFVTWRGALSLNGRLTHPRGVSLAHVAALTARHAEIGAAHA
ncbi:MAG: magnesium chelatase domain-containing protein [Solirubrobacteraceae bacterium]